MEQPTVVPWRQREKPMLLWDAGRLLLSQTESEALSDHDTKGGILSEYMPQTKPLGKLFPQRNRLISGLSGCGSCNRSKGAGGSLITADFALEQGKDIYALPGRVGDVC